MTTETGWTLETLKQLLDERHIFYKERADAQKEAVENAFNAAAKAVATAEENAERWRANANEWRAAMTDREAQFLHKNMGLVIGAISAVALLLAIFEKFVK